MHNILHICSFYNLRLSCALVQWPHSELTCCAWSVTELRNVGNWVLSLRQSCFPAKHSKCLILCFSSFTGYVPSPLLSCLLFWHRAGKLSTVMRKRTFTAVRATSGIGSPSSITLHLSTALPTPGCCSSGERVAEKRNWIRGPQVRATGVNTAGPRWKGVSSKHVFWEMKDIWLSACFWLKVIILLHLETYGKWNNR